MHEEPFQAAENSAVRPTGTSAQADPAAAADAIRLVETTLTRAVEARASDIHFEPFEGEFRVRCRVDGTLRDAAAVPVALAPAVTSRLKVLANLNIAERRLPQDGRIRLRVAGRSVDLRVSTLPTQGGESVVLRVLDPSMNRLDLDSVGLPDLLREKLERVLARPHGVLVVTGPTGSGKTTTLYGCLGRLNTPRTKILTIEDPVEYELEGVIQVPVNPAAGLTFARGLRSFLRQDPDVVMVGEIRDAETAQIAIQAALTGHFVLTTLHTNDAAATITRLQDMGIEPFLLASALEAVVAQRLLRRICGDCRKSFVPPRELMERLGLERPAAGEARWHRGGGCAACGGTGYRGRVALFELLVMDDGLREAVVDGTTTVQVREQARAQGLVPLREAGLAALHRGETTAEEVLKYT